jgi:hypothetical protein
MTCVLDLEVLYFGVLDTYAIVAFSSSLVALSSFDACTRGFFVSGSAGRPWVICRLL